MSSEALSSKKHGRNPKSVEPESAKFSEWNEARKKRKEAGYRNFEVAKTELYEKRYDELIEQGQKENANTKGRVAQKEEKALLNRLKKYKENHLLYLKDFDIHYSNNMSEKDLRICKNRQKMAGGFRTEAGRELYCDIISCIETIKRRGLNIYQSIIGLIAGTPGDRNFPCRFYE